MTVATLSICTTANAKKKPIPKMYIYGMSASFNDTIVYFTNIQEIDSAWIDTKNNFLQGREQYAWQLREHLTTQKQMPHRTCIVIANKNRKKLEKQYIKMKRLYTHNKKGQKSLHYDIRYLEDQDFQFKTVNIGDIYDNTNDSE